MILLKKWENLSNKVANPQVKPYYEILKRKQFSIFFKRILDIVFSAFLIIILLPIFLVIGSIIAIQSGFPVFYKQERVTANSKCFYVLKFRTMVKNADKIGTLVTVGNDPRITPIGHFLRKYRLDELPQVFNVFTGDMTFVGTRPEVPQYVDAYTDEMYATLLLPAGVTSNASIYFKDEAELLDNCDDVFTTYTKEILPEKMKYNLDYIKNFSLLSDFSTVIKTVFAVFK